MDTSVLKKSRSHKNNHKRKNFFFIFLWAVYFLSCNFVNTKAQANAGQKTPIFENITLSPKFSPDPQEIRGISGGSVPAKNVAGRTETATGPCVGFLDEKPDHTLNLTAFFNYLSLVVESPDDNTLVIVGPGGTWCNDDYQGKNPGVAGQWLPGTYKIWVAAYDKTKFHPYIIKISETK